VGAIAEGAASDATDPGAVVHAVVVTKAIAAARKRHMTMSCCVFNSDRSFDSIPDGIFVSLCASLYSDR
jgi:hypothetical protein